MKSGRGRFGKGRGVVTITATCNRFLWNMMRRIAGTLVQVGLGKISPADVAELLAAKGAALIRSGKLVYTAPSKGLCLDAVFYEPLSEVTGEYTPR